MLSNLVNYFSVIWKSRHKLFSYLNVIISSTTLRFTRLRRVQREWSVAKRTPRVPEITLRRTRNVYERLSERTRDHFLEMQYSDNKDVYAGVWLSRKQIRVIRLVCVCINAHFSLWTGPYLLMTEAKKSFDSFLFLAYFIMCEKKHLQLCSYKGRCFLSLCKYFYFSSPRLAEIEIFTQLKKTSSLIRAQLKILYIW